jgi:hypothetical protein
MQTGLAGKIALVTGGSRGIDHDRLGVHPRPTCQQEAQ